MPNLFARFMGPLDARFLGNDMWLVLNDLTYQRDIKEFITVPRGFITDYASTPRFVWLFMPKSGEYDPAAVVHDFIYVMGGVLPGKTYTKADADHIFLETMEVLGVGWVKRKLMHQAVKWFGKGSFELIRSGIISPPTFPSSPTK